MPTFLFYSGLFLIPRGEGHSGNPESRLSWGTNSTPLGMLEEDGWIP